MKSETAQGRCEQIMSERGIPGDPTCGKPAVMRYPAMGGGHIHLCEEHGRKHARYCDRWNGREWVQNQERNW